MKKRSASIIIAIIMSVVLLPVALGVGLLEIYGILSGSSFSSNITFFNVKDAPSLSIEKKVVDENTVSDPDNTDEFTFTMKLNGTVAKDQVYELRDSDGNQLIYFTAPGGSSTRLYRVRVETDAVSGEPTYFYTNVDDPEDSFSRKDKLIGDELKTDRNGQFRLRADQIARFYDLDPEDVYEIEEISNPPYEQKVPANGEKATGMVTPDGRNVTFVNTYPGGGGTPGSPTNFNVRKDIVYPEDYELPETPDFEFQIRLDGRPYANAAYSIRDAETEEETGTGTTDAEGKLSLKGNTYAVFEDIPVDVDYEVQELWDPSLDEEGWSSLGSLVREGATVKGGNTVSFTNKLAAFGVAKKMVDGVSVGDDAVFTFQIVDGQGEGYGEALAYYLYDRTKQLADDEIHYTATDGTFTLHAWESAVFFGLDAGEEYGVKETDSGQYVRAMPSDSPGYFGQTVRDDSVIVWEFYNLVVPEKLLVEKIIEDNSEDHSAPDAEFTFRITRQGEDGQFVPVSGARYDVTNITGTRTYAADEDGIFRIKAWDTAQFLYLNNGDVYRIEELEDILVSEKEAEGDSLEFINDGEISATFRLSVYNEETDGYEEVPEAEYNIKDAGGNMMYVPNPDGSSPIDYPPKDKEPELIKYATDAEARFVLGAGETAIFSSLPVNRHYMIQKVSELDVEGFTVGGSSLKEVTIEDSSTHVRFVNVYEDTGEPYIAIQKKTAKGNPLTGAELELYKLTGDKEEIIHKWVSGQLPEELQIEPGTYFIRETKAPEGFEVAEDVEIEVTDNSREIQTFEMIDIRDTEVPTGAEFLQKPWTKILIALLILLAGAAAAYFGLFRKHMKS